MHTMLDPLPVKVYKPPLPEPPAHDLQKSRLDEIRERGFIRVGYLKDKLPHAFRNTKGELVGFDIEMAHTLARDLGVSLEFVLLDRETMVDQLNDGYCDIIMSGVAVTVQRIQEMAFTKPYMNETLAFIVRDFRRDDFRNEKKLKTLDHLTIGVPDVPYYISKIQEYLPKAKIKVLGSPREFFKDADMSMDALVYTAESGSAWTLLYPEFSVVLPSSDLLIVPLAFPVVRDDRRLVDFLNAWIDLKQKDGTIDRLYAYWILGKGAETYEPRWSVIRNVLKWMD